MLKVDVDRNFTYRGNNWAFYVNQTLQTIGMRNIWDNQFNMEIQFKPIKRAYNGHIQTELSFFNQ